MAAGAGAAFFFAAFLAGFLAAFLAAGFLAAFLAAGFLAAFFAAGFLAAFFLAAGFLAAFLAVFLPAFLAVFLAAFLAGFLAAFLAVFFTAFLAAFFAGFLAAFLAAFLAGLAAFFTTFFAAFLAGFFAAFLVAMVNSSSVGSGNTRVKPSYKGTTTGLHPEANRRGAKSTADGWGSVALGAVAYKNAQAVLARADDLIWGKRRFAEGSLPMSTVEGARVECCEVRRIVGLTLITRFRKGLVAERKLIMCFCDVNYFAEKIFRARPATRRERRKIPAVQICEGDVARRAG